MDFALSKEDERYWASADSNQSELHCDLYGFVQLFHVLLLCFPSLHASLNPPELSLNCIKSIINRPKDEHSIVIFGPQYSHT